MRGSQAAFNKIPAADRNEDTLYFIYDERNNVTLYLGNKKISDGDGVDLQNLTLNSLMDVVIKDNLKNDTLLIYKIDSENNGYWTDISLQDESLEFIGANSTSSGRSGFVPAPEAGMTNLFLRSDGQWVSIPAGEQSLLTPDGHSIDIYNNQFSLKNYGKKYYKYDKEKKQFVEQKVDSDNPWKEGLELRVVKEDNQYILGWFETCPTSLFEIEDSLKELENSFSTLKTTIGENKGDNSTGIFAELNQKLNKDETYLKEEIEEKISDALSNMGTLKRTIVSSINDIDLNANDAENYIYMILNEDGLSNNKYNEYVVITVNGKKQLEQLGSWNVDLDDYVKKIDLLFSEINNTNFEIKNKTLTLKSVNISQVIDLENSLNSKVEKEEGKGLSSNDFTDELFNKLQNLLNINSINENEFELKNNQLNILSISPNKINGLTAVLESKVSMLEFEEQNLDFENKLNSLEEKVENKIDTVEQRLVWVELDIE